MYKVELHTLENFVKNKRRKILAEVPSSAITGFYVSHNGTKIIRDLIEKYNIFIMPSGEENFFRVSHMGIQSFYDLDELALYIHQIEHSK